jgi:hypothetical protein
LYKKQIQAYLGLIDAGKLELTRPFAVIDSDGNVTYATANEVVEGRIARGDAPSEYGRVFFIGKEFVQPRLRRVVIYSTLPNSCIIVPRLQTL